MLESLNGIADRPLRNLPEAFEKWWPDLEPTLTNAAASTEQDATPVREERDLLEEILATVRSIAQEADAARPLLERQARQLAQERRALAKVALDKTLERLRSLLPPDAEVSYEQKPGANRWLLVTTTEELPKAVVDELEWTARVLNADLHIVQDGRPPDASDDLDS